MAEDRYESSFKPGRVPLSSPAMKQSSGKLDSDHIFSVNSMAELNQIATDYVDLLSSADMAILFDLNLDPVKLFIWQPVTKNWREMASMSSTGPTLVEGTTADKGIIQFALPGEAVAGKAVQGHDPRLLKQWVAQATAPAATNVLWLDTTSANLLLKYHNGTAWTTITGEKLINDAAVSLVSVYSSKKVFDELAKKSDTGHTHAELTAHLINKANPHDVKAAQITDLTAFVTAHADVVSLISAKHVHTNASVLSSLSDSSNELFYKGKYIGRGDMLRSDFDKNSNGIVDQAESLFNGSSTITVEDIKAVQDKAHIHANNSVLVNTQEAFTTLLKGKLDGISPLANNYVHPSTHGADMITETADRKWVSPTEKTLWADKYTKAQVDSSLNLKETKSNKGIPSGYAGLDAGGTVPISQLPMSYKDTKVAGDIAERDVMNKYSGLRVFVADASADTQITGGGSAEYVWDGTKWILLTGYGLRIGGMDYAIDETHNKIIFKVKYADGTLKTAEVALT